MENKISYNELSLLNFYLICFFVTVFHSNEINSVTKMMIIVTCIVLILCVKTLLKNNKLQLFLVGAMILSCITLFVQKLGLNEKYKSFINWFIFIFMLSIFNLSVYFSSILKVNEDDYMSKSITGQNPYILDTVQQNKNLFVPSGSLRDTSEKLQRRNMISDYSYSNLRYDYPQNFFPLGTSPPAGFFFDNSRGIGQQPLSQQQFFNKYVQPGLKPYDYSQTQPVLNPRNGFVDWVFPPSSGKPVIGSVNQYAPLPEFTTSYNQVGYLKSSDETKTKLLTLYRRPISPQQDMYEYKIFDNENKITIPLRNVNGYLENNDEVGPIAGQGTQKWIAVIDSENKFVML